MVSTWGEVVYRSISLTSMLYKQPAYEAAYCVIKSFPDFLNNVASLQVFPRNSLDVLVRFLRRKVCVAQYSYLPSSLSRAVLSFMNAVIVSTAFFSPFTSDTRFNVIFCEYFSKQQRLIPEVYRALHTIHDQALLLQLRTCPCKN